MSVNTELQRRAARLVSQEVQCCMSSLVATLAGGLGGLSGRDLDDLCDRAAELATPVLNYESAAREAGWEKAPSFMLVLPHGDLDDDGFPPREESRDGKSYHWQGAVEQMGDDPHECEVYEHWAVTQWLAEKLIVKGERVDTDFAGLNVWARTTTGQAISADNVIEAITTETGYASGGDA